MVSSTASPGLGGTASGDLRRHNLSTILRIVQLSGPTSLATATETSFTRLASGTEIVQASLKEKRLMIGGGEAAFAALMDDPDGWTEPTG
jgi:hypothetical protein